MSTLIIFKNKIEYMDMMYLMNYETYESLIDDCFGIIHIQINDLILSNTYNHPLLDSDIF